MFRPFPVNEIRDLCGNATRIGVLDRNYSAATGGIFCHEVRASLQGQGEQLIQGYLTGVGGGDVIPELVHQVVKELSGRSEAGDPVWIGLDT
jgi:pyruvate/2-oxoacid:ferredoxin oxidoreductase alpha subunit